MSAHVQSGDGHSETTGNVLDKFLKTGVPLGAARVADGAADLTSVVEALLGGIRWQVEGPDSVK